MKKKKEKPAKPAPKPKEPVDVETKCGVPLPLGGYCARSLTCKSHSMGAKRAVPGRSQPYDILLAQHQKKNQARIQKQQMAEKHPDAPDADTLSTIDSDEETEAVMSALARYNPQPIVQPVHTPIGKQFALNHMCGLLRSALEQSQSHRQQTGTLGTRVVNGVVESTPSDYGFGNGAGTGGPGGMSGMGSPMDMEVGMMGGVVGRIARPGSLSQQGRKSSLSQSISQTA
ncbi:SCA7-domain-containing protein [Ascobolus immersus RN42]|uniref:SCA7-domain-containing protein n=1 Tax=Ascobolus immersus RN42 TaxID=1160509 RepID=A0A3N4I4C5_ASCIM|nr:SCA7-domain-containing protein [Ascobolus immersus RN42]